MISQQVSDGALRHHPAARLPGRVHSEHAHAPSPPSRVQSFPLARAATSRHSRGGHPHTHRPGIALQVSQASSIDRAVRRRRHPPLQLNPACRRRTSSRCAGGTMGAHGRCALRIPAAHMWLLCVDVPSAETCRPGRENLHTGRVMHTAVVRFLGRDGTTAAVRAACTGMSSRAGGSMGLRWAEDAVHVVVCRRGRERRGVACGCGRAVAVGMFARPTLLRHAFLPHGPMDSPRAEDLCG